MEDYVSKDFVCYHFGKIGYSRYHATACYSYLNTQSGSFILLENRIKIVVKQRHVCYMKYVCQLYVSVVIFPL